MKKIMTFGRYTKKRFGEKVYKIPISISGFTCPNIDGTVAIGGCTFCENDSFSPQLQKASPLDKSKKFYLNLQSVENPLLDQQLAQLQWQFQTLSKALKKSHNAKKFLVYFQSFTNTYAPLETLKALYEKALSFENVVGMSIGTRTDSITDETLAYLSQLAQKHEVWVEYGVQTLYDATLAKINRGHDSANIRSTIAKTKALGLNVCAHLIYGLPDEDASMMLHSLDETLNMGVDSIKIHPQYVVKKTALANSYTKGEFVPISLELYTQLLIESLKRIPATLIVQRISAGIENDSLLAPSWCYNKNSTMAHLRQALKANNIAY
ncbi:MAG: radical SAM protein [Sulfurovum sp. PC08-66]|nr:MAG: radical SAM protein [Sulfurovum sp. PC08-66]KIM12556.1 MAG: radical SAM protein [Sulfuricurvum sp. PC08-66]